MAVGKIGPEGGLQNLEASSSQYGFIHFIGNRSDGSIVSWGYPEQINPVWWIAADGEATDVLSYSGLGVDAFDEDEDWNAQSYQKKECDTRFTGLFGGMACGIQGSNEYGQGGDDYTSELIRRSYTYNDSAMAFAGVFGHHVVTILGNANLMVWGRNDYHQCGLSEDSPILKTDQTQEAGPFLHAGAGRDFTVAIRQDGTLWVMGRNDVGQCGIPAMSVVTELTLVGTRTDWAYVSCGVDHTLLLTTLGQLWGMGGNADGQLGLGHNNNVYEPVRLNGYIFDCVAAGYNFSVGFTKDREWYGWGSNSRGQLSLDTTIGSTYNTPQLGTIDISADGGNRIKHIGAGAHHTAAITNHIRNGYVYACGDNTYGQCGNTLVDDDPENPDPPITTLQQCTSLCPTAVGGIYEDTILRSDIAGSSTWRDWIMVECGSYHTVLFKYDYDVRAFFIGRNDSGQCNTINVRRDTNGRWEWDVENGVQQSWVASGDDFSVILLWE